MWLIKYGRSDLVNHSKALNPLPLALAPLGFHPCLKPQEFLKGIAINLFCDGVQSEQPEFHPKPPVDPRARRQH